MICIPKKNEASFRNSFVSYDLLGKNLTDPPQKFPSQPSLQHIHTVFEHKITRSPGNEKFKSKVNI